MRGEQLDGGEARLLARRKLFRQRAGGGGGSGGGSRGTTHGSNTAKGSQPHGDDELAELQKVVLESSAQFDALGKLYVTNSNYKVCEQDENRVGILDCEILLADVKRLRALQYPRHDEQLAAYRQQLLTDALEQLESAEKVCACGTLVGVCIALRRNL